MGAKEKSILHKIRIEVEHPQRAHSVAEKWLQILIDCFMHKQLRKY